MTRIRNNAERRGGEAFAKKPPQQRRPKNTAAEHTLRKPTAEENQTHVDLGSSPCGRRVPAYKIGQELKADCDRLAAGQDVGPGARGNLQLMPPEHANRC